MQRQSDNQIVKLLIFDFFDFLMNCVHLYKGQWKTDKDKTMQGHMPIVPFPVLY